MNTKLQRVHEFWACFYVSNSIFRHFFHRKLTNFPQSQETFFGATCRASRVRAMCSSDIALKTNVYRFLNHNKFTRQTLLKRKNLLSEKSTRMSRTTRDERCKMPLGTPIKFSKKIWKFFRKCVLASFDSAYRLSEGHRVAFEYGASSHRKVALQRLNIVDRED